MKFKKFANELKKRIGTEYHVVKKCSRDVIEEFNSKGFSVNDDYLEFINEIGYGAFFGRDLIIFPLDEIQQIIFQNENMNNDLIPIGYDGTTTGFYVLSKDKNDKRIYWFDIQTDDKSVIDKDFSNWIEKLPSKLFNENNFLSYKKIKDIQTIENVINERKKFEVSIKSFDKNLIKPPGKENDFLPRYNRIIISVTKKEDSFLNLLTVIIKRTESEVGEDNKEYLTLDISQLLTGQTIEFERCIFDPFNLPFDNIVCEYNYNIDLRTNQRTRYKEIVDFL